MKKNNKSRVVIIGTGAAGIAAADAVRKNDKEIEIIIVSDDNYPAYKRPMLSEYLHEPVSETKFYMRQKDWYVDNDIELVQGVRAMKIISEKKELLLSNGDALSYDTLILANGAQAFLPAFPGIEKKGVFSVRTFQDVLAIREYISASNVRSAVIIGGGVLALEACHSLIQSKLQVTIIERADRVLSRQLNQQASEIFEEKLKSAGVIVEKNATTAEILGDDYVTGVLLDDARVLDSKLVIICAGARSMKDLVIDTAIVTNNGIVVDEHMCTSVDGVYACGDVAEFNGRIQGLWSTALQQGAVAGANASGINKVYEERIQPVIFSGFGVSIFSIGDIGNSENKEYMTIIQNEDDRYCAFYFVDDIFVGALVINDASLSVKLINALQNKMPINEFKEKIGG